MLKNRELYFSDPKHFNDPVDCKINIYSAFKAAVDLAEKENLTVKNKLKELQNLDDLFVKIENDVKHAGVYSLSKEQNNVLMWSHYAGGHSGFSVGFNLSNNFKEYNEKNEIVGTDEVYYSEDNPFVQYFFDISKKDKMPPWDEFWRYIFSMCLLAKSYAWKYENEVRIIRGKPGKANYSPSEVNEIIFGLNMNAKKRKNITKLLSGSEWSHVQMKEIIREHDGFKLKVVNC